MLPCLVAELAKKCWFQFKGHIIIWWGHWASSSTFTWSFCFEFAEKVHCKDAKGKHLLFSETRKGDNLLNFFSLCPFSLQQARKTKSILFKFFSLLSFSHLAFESAEQRQRRRERLRELNFTLFPHKPLPPSVFPSLLCTIWKLNFQIVSLPLALD